MIGFGDPHGYAGILHTIGGIGQVGGIIIIALHITYIGTIAIGITTIIPSAPIALVTTITPITNQCIVP